MLLGSADNAKGRLYQSTPRTHKHHPAQNADTTGRAFLRYPWATAFVVALTCATLPLIAEAGVFASAVRGALAKRAAPSAFGKRAYGKPNDVVIDRAKHPQAAAHIEQAQKKGQPSVLHLDRAGAKTRRQENLASIDRTRKPAPNYQRDEYPPAFTKENAGGTSVRWISGKDNAGAGATMRWQTDGLPDGAKIRVLVK